MTEFRPLIYENADGRKGYFPHVGLSEVAMRGFVDFVNTPADTGDICYVVQTSTPLALDFAPFTIWVDSTNIVGGTPLIDIGLVSLSGSHYEVVDIDYFAASASVHDTAEWSRVNVETMGMPLQDGIKAVTGEAPKNVGYYVGVFPHNPAVSSGGDLVLLIKGSKQGAGVSI